LLGRRPKRAAAGRHAARTRPRARVAPLQLAVRPRGRALAGRVLRVGRQRERGCACGGAQQKVDARGRGGRAAARRRRAAARRRRR
jgi:hypothetical protein